jgi:hypothetical protein
LTQGPDTVTVGCGWGVLGFFSSLTQQQDPRQPLHLQWCSCASAGRALAEEIASAEARSVPSNPQARAIDTARNRRTIGRD